MAWKWWRSGNLRVEQRRRGDTILEIRREDDGEKLLGISLEGAQDLIFALMGMVGDLKAEHGSRDEALAEREMDE